MNAAVDNLSRATFSAYEFSFRLYLKFVYTRIISFAIINRNNNKRIIVWPIIFDRNFLNLVPQPPLQNLVGNDGARTRREICDEIPADQKFVESTRGCCRAKINRNYGHAAGLLQGEFVCKQVSIGRHRQLGPPRIAERERESPLTGINVINPRADETFPTPLANTCRKPTL